MSKSEKAIELDSSALLGINGIAAISATAKVLRLGEPTGEPEGRIAKLLSKIGEPPPPPPPGAS